MSTASAPTALPAIDTDALIIGAGPAGLAVAACLGRERVPYRIAERARDVGASWRRHYDRLHLHTWSRCSALPFVPFPAAAGRYPSRADVVAYLDAYARRFGIAPDLGIEVERARCQDGRWLVEAREAPEPPAPPASSGSSSDAGAAAGSAGHPGAGAVATTAAAPRRTYRARSLVVATGYNREPHRPRFPGEEAFGGTLIHSSAYRSGAPFRDKDVLVVGAGNTGAEIALDLHEHGARPALAIRGPIHVSPRDAYGVPVQLFGIAMRRLPTWLADRMGLMTSKSFFPDLEQLGLRRPAEGPVTQVLRRGRIPLIDVGTIDLCRRGLCKILPGPERFTRDGVVFAGGLEKRFDAVVLATGFKAKLDFLDGVDGASGLIDDRGYPTVHGAEVVRAGIAGLYFLGFANPISGALREIAIEARRIARHLATAGRRPGG
jgi:hypothetical protein